MIIRLRQREARARVGAILNRADRARIARKLSEWTYHKLAIDGQSIWWRINLRPCSCGSAPHMFMDIVGYGVDPRDALFICACPRCGKLARPESSGLRFAFHDKEPFTMLEEWGTVRATRQAARNWNKGINPPEKNPLSISWGEILKRSEVVF